MSDNAIATMGLVIQAILLCIQVPTLIALIIYVAKTWEMASATRQAAEATKNSVAEMREARDQETAPYIVVYFDVPAGPGLIYLVVKNIGRSIATQVKLTFTPPLRTSNNTPPMEELSFIKDGIESMPPNYEIRTIFDGVHAYFSKTDLPMKYDANISYYGGIHKSERVSRQTLDLSANKGLVYVKHKDMDDLVEQVEKLVKESREIRDAADNISTILGKGILITNPNLFVSRLEPKMHNWEDAILAKASEFEGMWIVSYREECNKGFDLSGAKAHALLVSNQMLSLIANRPDGMKTGLLSSASTIAEHLHELGRIKFYMDGGTSLKAFNDLGEAIVQDIKNMREQSTGPLHPPLPPPTLIAEPADQPNLSIDNSGESPSLSMQGG